MNLLDSPLGRKILFAGLYFSEGAPIGFIWLALPTRLKSLSVPLTEITWLTAILVVPWTFKFLWAPLIDSFRSERWTFRHWILSAQAVMIVTLIPITQLDPVEHFSWLAGFFCCTPSLRQLKMFRSTPFVFRPSSQMSEGSSTHGCRSACSQAELY